MPSKAAQLIAFFFVLLVSAALHRYVYLNLKRLIQHDYPNAAQKLMVIARTLFIAMDTPFLFIFFRGRIHAELTTLTRVVLYPFSVWQAIMLMWALVLVPLSLWRRRHWLAIPWLIDRLRKLFSKKDEMDEDDDGFEPELEIVRE